MDKGNYRMEHTMTQFKRGDMVRHEDGRTGQVERVTVDRVTVQFPYHWRTSVVAAKNLTLADTADSASG